MLFHRSDRHTNADAGGTPQNRRGEIIVVVCVRWRGRASASDADASGVGGSTGAFGLVFRLSIVLSSSCFPPVQSRITAVLLGQRWGLVRTVKSDDMAEYATTGAAANHSVLRVRLHKRVGAFLDRAATLLQLHDIIHGGLQLR